MLTDWGVEPFSERIHLIGINYLAQVGRRAGYVAVSEYPVQPIPATAELGAVLNWVVPDVVWWNRDSRRAQLIGEFERYEPGGNKHRLLKDKIRNLLWAHHELGTGPRALLLLLWTMSGVPVRGTEEFQSLVRSGFRVPGGHNIPGLDPLCRFIVASAVFTSSNGVLRLKEILL